MAARVLIAIIAVLALAATAAGCGGGGEPDPLSKTAFVKQGNEICVHATDEREAAMKEVFKDGSQGSSDEELEHYVSDAVVPPIQDMTDELDGLGVPKGEEKQVEAMLNDFEVGIEKLESDPSSSLNPTDVFAKAYKMALANGLTDCTI
jgi:hypothetical protein